MPRKVLCQGRNSSHVEEGAYTDEGGAMPVDIMFRRMELRWPREVRLASLLVAPRALETCGAGNRFHDYSLLLCVL